MERKYKLVRIGAGLQLYRVVRAADNFDIGAQVSGNVGTKEKPWTVRWMDFFNTKHEAHFRTRRECLDYVNAF
jgi:hypothetical protein